VNETQATTVIATPVFPPGRYGRRRAPRRGRRWLAGACLAGVVVVALALAWRLYSQYGDPTYDAAVTRVTESTDTSVTVEFTVNLPPGGAATCTIRARAVTGEQVGLATVQVTAPPGQQRVPVSYRLDTTGPVRAVDVPGCHPVERR
jgi:hypothetical protein